ncbi:MAG: hypothetical protein K2K54_10460 [Lachnospiraceae bacterium]|nr:hypothetical protein [Lachnospiraceae bacterium]
MTKNLMIEENPAKLDDLLLWSEKLTDSISPNGVSRNTSAAKSRYSSLKISEYAGIARRYGEKTALMKYLDII